MTAHTTTTAKSSTAQRGSPPRGGVVPGPGGCCAVQLPGVCHGGPGGGPSVMRTVWQLAGRLGHQVVVAVRGLSSVAAVSSAIEVTELTIRYGDLVAVDALSFTASAGEIVALLGPNGAGK